MTTNQQNREELDKQKLDVSAVLKVLIAWGKENSGDGVWKGYEWLADETGITIKKLKEYMKVLLYFKVVNYSYLVNDDGQPHGKGYIIAENIWHYNSFIESTRQSAAKEAREEVVSEVMTIIHTKYPCSEVDLLNEIQQLTTN